MPADFTREVVMMGRRDGEDVPITVDEEGRIVVVVETA